MIVLRWITSLWQQTKKHQLLTVSIVVPLIVFIAFALAVLKFGWNWTGFTNFTIPSSQFQRGKTLWDWLQLLIIPLVLAVAALLFNLSTTRTEQKIAAQRYKQDQEIAAQRYEQDRQIAAQRYEQDQKIALDKQREDLLQIYIGCMSELLLKEKLLTSAVDAEVRIVARVRTTTILFQLDARRIGYVFAFLRESRLMSNPSNDSIVSLKYANLDKINFSQANLNSANLSDAKLIGANLSDAYLGDTNLSGTLLRGADLSGADLTSANLSSAILCNTNLCGAEFINADLTGAILYEADLSGTNLRGADLSNTELRGAKNVTAEQLDKAKSLKGAIMPDGTKHP